MWDLPVSSVHKHEACKLVLRYPYHQNKAYQDSYDIVHIEDEDNLHIVHNDDDECLERGDYLRTKTV